MAPKAEKYDSKKHGLGCLCCPSKSNRIFAPDTENDYRGFWQYIDWKILAVISAGTAISLGAIYGCSPKYPEARNNGVDISEKLN